MKLLDRLFMMPMGNRCSVDYTNTYLYEKFIEQGPNSTNLLILQSNGNRIVPN